MSAVAQKLENLVGSAGVCSWERLEAGLSSQIAQAVTPETQIDCIVYPGTQEELAEVVKCAALNRWPFLLCGSGSKLHWGGLAAGTKLVISTARLDRLIDHAVGDLTVTAEAGLRFANLQALLAEAGQFLAVDPAYAESATLGGIVATADTGALRQRYGGIRDMLIGISFVRSDGQVAKAGGRVVKNVAGYDLMKLFTGSYGTLGVISQLTFRIYPLPSAARTVVLLGDGAAIAQATATLLSSALTPTAIELVSPETVAALGFSKEMGLFVRFQSIEVSVAEQASQLLQVGQTLGLQATVLTDLTGTDENDLWQRLREQMDAKTPEPAITCKLGVLSSKAVETLNQISTLAAIEAGRIHAGSGLGMVRFKAGLSSQVLLEIRSLCQAQAGYLTVLEAPIALKQQLDPWGYPGNALELMRKIKQQFDPDHLFSPHRFVAEI